LHPLHHPCRRQLILLWYQAAALLCCTPRTPTISLLVARCQCLCALHSPVNDDEPPDEFYDLNMEDLARLQQQAAAKKQVCFCVCVLVYLCGWAHMCASLRASCVAEVGGKPSRGAITVYCLLCLSSSIGCRSSLMTHVCSHQCTHTHAHSQAEAGFRPRALREAEGAARAAALGPVRVRLHYPDGSLVQAQFAATDCLGTVLVRGVLGEAKPQHAAVRDGTQGHMWGLLLPLVAP
jgi:hypothetical protein